MKVVLNTDFTRAMVVDSKVIFSVTTPMGSALKEHGINGYCIYCNEFIDSIAWYEDYYDARLGLAELCDRLDDTLHATDKCKKYLRDI